MYVLTWYHEAILFSNLVIASPKRILFSVSLVTFFGLVILLKKKKILLKLKWIHFMQHNHLLNLLNCRPIMHFVHWMNGTNGKHMLMRTWVNFVRLKLHFSKMFLSIWFCSQVQLNLHTSLFAFDLDTCITFWRILLLWCIWTLNGLPTMTKCMLLAVYLWGVHSVIILNFLLVYIQIRRICLLILQGCFVFHWFTSSSNF
jgi:hypothetical protein